MVAVFTRIKNVCRAVLKACGWIGLLTLPVTLLPILHAVFGGIYLSIWLDRHIDAVTHKFVDGVKDFLYNDWGVGGDAPSFREWEDTHNDFHIMRINSNDWIQKLGFQLPIQYSLEMGGGDVGIDKHADLTTLMRDMSYQEDAEKPTEQWLWLSDYAFPLIDQWDAAFESAIQYAYAHSSLNKTGFFFARCLGTAEFLCSVWATRSPALLHFKVEDEPPAPGDINPDFLYPICKGGSAHPDRLRPVTVRLIEFPLAGAYTGLASNVFSGFNEQVSSIIASDRLYEQFDPYEQEVQIFQHFNDHINELTDVKGSILYHFNKAYSWTDYHITEPLRLQTAMEYLHGIVFAIASTLGAFCVTIPLRLMSEIVGTFLARPKLLDWAMPRIHDRPNPNPNPMADMDGWMTSIMDIASSVKSSNTEVHKPIITPYPGVP